MKVIDKVKYIWEQITSINDEPVLRNGLAESQILSSFQKIGLSQPQDLVELYKWSNGISYLDGFLSFSDLDFAIGTYSFHKKHYSSWGKSWFPILHNNGDTLYCVNLESSAVMVIDQELGIEEKTADHYESYLDGIIYGYENKLFEFDEDGMVDNESIVWIDIAKKFGIRPVEELL